MFGYFSVFRQHVYEARGVIWRQILAKYQFLLRCTLTLFKSSKFNTPTSSKKKNRAQAHHQNITFVEPKFHSVVVYTRKI